LQTSRSTRRQGVVGASERGAAAAELVIILPIILTLVLGTIAIGTAYFYKLNLTEGAREGARVGATLREGIPNTTFVPSQAWLQEVATVATSTAGRWETVCVTYTGRIAFRPTGQTTTQTLRRTNGGGDTFGGGPCFNDGRPANERRVQVVMTNTGPFDNFFFTQRTLNLESRSLARFERPYTAGDL
jgi:hypothetical protein